MSSLLTMIINNTLLFAFISIPFYGFKKYWHVFFYYLSEDLMKSFFPSFVQVIAFFIVLGIYIPLYMYEPKFLQRFRVNNLEWPWKKNKSHWEKLKKSLFWIYFRNYVLIAPIVTAIYHHLSATKTSLEDYPSL